MFSEDYNRREHAGGKPRSERIEDQWIPTCDFPYEVLHEFSHDEPKEYPIEKFSDALKQIALWITHDGKFQERGLADRAMVFAGARASEPCQFRAIYLIYQRKSCAS